MWKLAVGKSAAMLVQMRHLHYKQNLQSRAYSRPKENLVQQSTLSNVFSSQSNNSKLNAQVHFDLQ